MEGIDDDFLTLNEEDLVDITDDAIEAIADEHINLVKCLQDEATATPIYTIGSDGKLVPVSKIKDFEKYHTGSPPARFQPNVISLPTNEGGPLSKLKILRNIRTEITSMPQQSARQLQVITINQPIKLPKVGNSTNENSFETASGAKLDEVTTSGSVVSGLPLSNPITYINGIPGQIISGQQLQQLQAILGYQPQIIRSDATSLVAQSDNADFDDYDEPPTVIIKKPRIEKPPPKPRRSSKQAKRQQHGISQTVIAKESVTYQREKSSFFPGKLVLSPLIAPAVAQNFTEVAAHQTSHLSKSMAFIEDITRGWNMQGCVTCGAGIEGQVFAPRVIVPEMDSLGNDIDIIRQGGKPFNNKFIVSAQNDADQDRVESTGPNGLYGAYCIDICDTMFTKAESPPTSIGEEFIYTGSENTENVNAYKVLVEEDNEEEKSDMEVEFAFGEKEDNGEMIKLNLKKMAEAGVDENQWCVVNNLEQKENITSKHDAENTKPSELELKEAMAELNENQSVFDKFTGYCCYLCVYSTKSRRNLIDHWLDAHKIAKPYTCPYCTLDFGVSCNVVNHVIQHHPDEKVAFSLNSSPIYKEKIEVFMNFPDDKSLDTPTIEASNESAGMYRRDVPASHKGFVFQCLGCSYRTACVWAIRNHIKVSHFKLKPYACPYCSRTFDILYDAKQHVTVHHEDKDNKVYICKSKTKKMSLLVLNNRFSVIPLDMLEIRQEDLNLLGTHLWDISQDLTLVCKTCCHQHTDRSAMYTHVVAEHRNIQGIVCPRCRFYNTVVPKALKHGWLSCESCWFFLNLNMGHLQPPVYSAQSSSLFLCLECSYFTMDKPAMTRHIKYQHLKCRPFFCAYCDYSGMEKQKVRQHILMHHKNRTIHILKNMDMDNRSLSTMLGMFKQVTIPLELLDKYERLSELQKHEYGNTATVIGRPRGTGSRSPVKRKRYRQRVASQEDTSHYYKCNVCELSCDEYTSIYQHIKETHLNVKPHTCGYCAFGSVDRDLVVMHLQQKHPGFNIYVRTNYRMLNLLDRMVRPYFTRVFNGDKSASGRITDIDESSQENSETIYYIKVEPDDEDPLPVEIKQEPCDNGYYGSMSKGNELGIAYLSADEIKQEVFSSYPDFQQDKKLVQEPVIVLKDVLQDLVQLPVQNAP